MPKSTPTAIVITWKPSTAKAIEEFNDELPQGYDPKTKSTTFENCGVKFERQWVTLVTPDNREYSYPSDNIARIKKQW
tara:strand:+ start:4694 stop:4927 length:234 start_codon:yes stop_codon:yes gene_type:complete